MALTETIYVAIRKASDDGHEWMDRETCSSAYYVAKAKAESLDVSCGLAWALANRLQRIARCVVTEIVEP